MKKINISSWCKMAKSYAIKNSPHICTGAGIALSIGAVASAIWATIKAKEQVDILKKDDESDNLKKTTVAKAIWFYYIPTVVTEGFAIAFFIGAKHVNDKRNAALAAAYSLSTTALKEYKDKVVETIGEKKERSIRDEVVKDKIDKNQPTNGVIITNSGETLFYDTLSDRYFVSDVNTIRKAINKLNFEMFSENYISLNEFYYEIGLKGIPVGDDLGWRIENGYLDVRFIGHMTSDEKACLAFEFNNPPEYGYKQLY